ncbi:serine/threonine kinase family protein, partial [Plesiocystis pacifica SIR-1]
MVRDDEDNAAPQARADRALNLEDSTSDFPLDDLFGGPPSDDPEVSPLAATLAPDASAEASRLRPGDRLDHYELIGELGRGGMGVVYAARDTKLGRKVAIKQLLIQGHPRLQERFVREAMAMAKLSHPNVVPIHEIGEHEGSAYIVMEYVEGQTLKAWMTQPRSLDAVLEVFAAAGAGLVAAHAKGLVHRDFKPDNIMLGEDGRVRVMDFGLARTGEDEREPPTALSVTGETDGTDGPDESDASPREGVATSLATSFVSPAGSGPMDGPERTQVSFTEVEAAAAPTPSPERDATLAGFAGLTRTGALLGTPAYMSPEQLRGDPVGPASDQFSFCVALYEAVHGVRPFDAGTLG